MILSIETSTKVCSVAIHDKGNLLAISELFTEKSHSGMLTILIQNLAKTCQIQLEDLDAIAVGKGPGSYTGLRIGVSTAKGLCFALEKPLIAVNTLDALAHQVKNRYENTLLVPMLDARRMEVYCAIYSENLTKIQETEAIVIEGNSFSELLKQHKMFFFGDGASKCAGTIQHENAIFSNELIHPSAKSLGELAEQAFNQGNFEDLVTFEPFYLKEFVGTIPKKM